MQLVHRIVTFAAALALTLGLALDARADAPRVLIRGVLLDSAGHLINEETQVTFRIYETESGGVPVADVTQSVRAVRGAFSAILDTRVLGDANVRSYNSLWVTSQADRGPESGTRTQLRFARPAAPR